MFGLSFLSPLFLIGLSAASLPLIIHLLSREKPKTLRFSSLKFISESHQENIKRHRLKQLILLLMRMAIFALLALTFARPFFAKSPALIALNQRRNVIIILDNSFSMGYSNRFSAAKQKAIEIVRSLKDRDRAALIVISSFPQVAYELSEISEKKEAIITAIQSQKLSYNSTSYPSAIRAAGQILTPIRNESKEIKEICLIADLQKVGWRDFVETDKLKSNIRLNLIDLSQKDSTNLAVTAIKSPEAATAKAGSAKVTGRISNFGSQTAKGVKVKLVLDDVEISQKSVEVLPNDLIDVSFDLKIKEAKSHYGYVAIDDDKLTIDNIRYFSIQSFGTINVHCVDGEPDKRAEESESFYVIRALNSRDDSVSILGPLNVSSSAQIPKDLSGYDIIILLNLDVGILSRQDVELFRNFVKSGGSLIVALGDRVKPNSYNQLFINEGGGRRAEKEKEKEKDNVGAQHAAPNATPNSESLLPGRIGSIRGEAKKGEEFSILAQLDYNHPSLGTFKEPGHGDFTTVRFYSYFEVSPFPEAKVFGKYENGEAAFLEKSYGLGKVMLITSTLDSEWNDFPKHAVFLPFIYETIKYMNLKKSGQAEENIVGEQIHLDGFSPQEELSLLSPSKERKQEKELKEVVADAEGSISFEASEPGIYKLDMKSKSKSKERFFAVNVDSRESNLIARDADEVKSMLTQTDISNEGATGQSPLQAGVRINRTESEKNQQLWWYLILLLLILALAELTLANRIS